MKHSQRYRYLWVGLLLVAGLLRLTAPNWDGGIAAHPDERFLIGVAQDVPLYGDLCSAAPDFPYGHLPLAAAQLLVSMAPAADPIYAARLISGLVGVLIVALAGACGRRLGGRDAALLSGVLAAFSPFLIQQAHFYTVDPWATAFVCGSVLAGSRRQWTWSGALLGLGLASKVSVVVTLLPLVLSIVETTGALREQTKVDGLGKTLRAILSVVAGATVTFGLAAPWALLQPAACWRGPIIQSMMAAGRYELPYTQQYEGTLPYVYPLAQMALWGLGPLVVPLGVWGLLRAALSGGKPANGLPWLWTAIFFGVVGGTYVKFPRYMLPLYPWWTAWAAYAVGNGRRRRRTWRIVAGISVVTTGFLGLAQVGLYGPPHPWIAASRWIYDNVPTGSTIVVETWEHPLPVPLPKGDSTRFEQVFLPVYVPEDDEKREALLTAAAADVIAVASRRAYGALSKEPARYAETLDWYRDQFRLRDVRIFTRCPRLGPLAVTDDPWRATGLTGPPEGTTTLAERCGVRWALRLPRLDESYRVYDAPLTMLLVDDTP